MNINLKKAQAIVLNALQEPSLSAVRLNAMIVLPIVSLKMVRIIVLIVLHGTLIVPHVLRMAALNVREITSARA